MIAVTLKAVFDRARLPAGERRTTFVYIDEASEYLDANVAQLLIQSRKFGCGLVLALQSVSQIPLPLRDLVMANTSIKLAGGVSAKDARYLAAELQTTADFILSAKKNSRSTCFAAYVRNQTPTATRMQVPFLTLERMPRMSDAQFQEVLARNRQEVSGGMG